KKKHCTPQELYVKSALATTLDCLLDLSYNDLGKNILVKTMPVLDLCWNNMEK
ncbi:31208_t:CDS:1, partial [Gigaspora margarita]